MDTATGTTITGRAPQFRFVKAWQAACERRQWNKAVEDQAIGRVRHIGQKRPVGVVRLVAQHTVEEQMLAVQDMKHSIFECTMSKKGDRLQHSRLDVVLQIFREPWPTQKMARILVCTCFKTATRRLGQALGQRTCILIERELVCI